MMKTNTHYKLFPVVFVYDEVLLRIFNETSLFSNIIFLLLFALSAGLFCSALTSLFKKAINRIITIVILAVTALGFTIECMIKNTYQTYMDLTSIMAGTGGVVHQYGSDLWAAIARALPVILLFFLPLILYLFLGSGRIPARRYHPLAAVLFLALSLISGGLGILLVSNSSLSAKYKGQFEYDTAVSAFGLITGTRLDMKYSFFGNKYATELTVVSQETEDEQEETQTEEEETEDSGYNVMEIDFDSLIESADNDAVAGMHEYVFSLEPTNKNEYTGLFEGKNLIIITAEAFSKQVISEELTPTLYRLANEGIKFTDFYQPAWGGSTSTGEYSILLGLVPTNGVNSILETIGCNLYFTMGNQLQRLNYTSLAFHNGSYTYYDRDKTHTNFGYDQFLAWGNGLEDLLSAWSGDQETFEATLETYIDSQPFTAYYMTYSGHCTYDADDSRTEKNLEYVKEVLGEDTYKDTTLYYFCYQLELEYALESMVSMLEERGIADDTVIVLCTDHYPYGLAKSTTLGNSEDYLLDLYKVDSYDAFVRDNTTLIIWSACIEDEGITVDTPVMSLDILPTLLNLFGVEYDSRLLVGRDVFSDADPLVLWNDYSFITDKGVYDAATGEFTANEGETVDDSYVESIRTIVSNKISFSSQVMEYDYYATIFGEDPETGGTGGVTDTEETDSE
ncbi:MAG: LTA synthase family protein [Lachnospiraceae bacterium]|nr:LTA synthase family protein [Lachnospiraceae bacterium]